MPERPIRFTALAAGLTVTLALSGCGSGENPSLERQAAPVADTSQAAPDPTIHLVAEANIEEVEIFEAPDAPEADQTLENPTENGGPLVFLVKAVQEPWLEVYLPVRPNGSSGWIHIEDVTLSQHNYRIQIALEEHEIRVFEGQEMVLEEPVGVGTEDTPTPGGVFYIKELLQPPNPRGPYGAYAYGLSGFSNVLESFAGGDGVIGIHGTNDPSTIGEDVSHGCIRVTNDVITQMTEFLPLGTPVEILP